MIKVSGIYDNGNITLDKVVISEKPVKVIVTFADADVVAGEKRLTLNDFSFFKSRGLLAAVKGTLSDAVTDERKSE